MPVRAPVRFAALACGLAAAIFTAGRGVAQGPPVIALITKTDTNP